MGVDTSKVEKKTNKKAILIQGNEIMDRLVNWESSQTEDSGRFSQEANQVNGNKTVKNFDTYLKIKASRAQAKKEALKAKSTSKKQSSEILA